METTKEKILNHFKHNDNWGEVCNDIQDVAFEVLPESSLRRYTKLSQKDMAICDGSDFVTFNGQYFDWKEFTYRSRDIVSAFLNYFTEKDLLKIERAYTYGL